MKLGAIALVAAIFFSGAARAGGAGARIDHAQYGRALEALHRSVSDSPAALAKGVRHFESALSDEPYSSRELAISAATLGPRFVRSLQHSGAGDRWLDVGAADGTELFHLAASRALPVRIVGFSLRHPHPEALALMRKRAASEHLNFEYREGDILESTPANMGQFKTITDAWGPGAYLRAMPTVLENEGRLLTHDGLLGLTLTSSHLAIRDTAGRRLSLGDYLRGVHGLALVDYREVDGVAGAVLARTRGDILAPPLTQTFFRDYHPPMRGFRLDRN